MTSSRPLRAPWNFIEDFRRGGLGGGGGRRFFLVAFGPLRSASSAGLAVEPDEDDVSDSRTEDRPFVSAGIPVSSRRVAVGRRLTGGLLRAAALVDIPGE